MEVGIFTNWATMRQTISFEITNFGGAIMARKTNRREFVQVAGLAASGLMAADQGVACRPCRRRHHHAAGRVSPAANVRGYSVTEVACRAPADCLTFGVTRLGAEF